MQKHDFETRLVEAFRNRPEIMAVIISIVRDFNVAEDVFQNTMLETVKSAGCFDAEREFLPWVKGIARNMAMRHIRDKSRAPKNIETEALETLSAIIKESGFGPSWENEAAGLRRCLKKLPEKQCGLFRLRYSENLKGEALAERTGMNVKSLRTTLLRIRRKLRECIDAFLKRAEAPGEGRGE